jgi:predicted N-formylglutamate amidohydrolase
MPTTKSNGHTAIIISCEHAVNTIPPMYADLFTAQQSQLNSHYGIDFGALEIAKFLHAELTAKYLCTIFSTTTSRLLIDCNRSLHHRHCFSSITKQLPDEAKQKIIVDYYRPYRNSIERSIQQYIDQQLQVLHLSIHSFTPELDGVRRTADLGLLYDPLRFHEKIFVHHWQQQLKQKAPQFKIRLNYPYRGISDGLTTSLRIQYQDVLYLGVEVEANQTITKYPDKLDILRMLLLSTLNDAIKYNL